jgi:hypothetical protein
MPKVMVLFYGDEGGESMLDAVVAGAKSVRFTEVEIRAIGDESDPLVAKHKRVDPARPTGEADGVVIVANGAGSSGAGVAQIIAHLSNSERVRDLVLGVAADASVVDRAARTGAIVIVSRATASHPNASDEARALGVRVAKVAGWVRHGLGHEAEHQHGHTHSHDDHTPHEHASHDHHDHGKHEHHDYQR